tara:strand:+ start:25 stop:231 length:207 start_codon:yes stop_codon:yes gene_type:complete
VVVVGIILMRVVVELLDVGGTLMVIGVAMLWMNVGKQQMKPHVMMLVEESVAGILGVILVHQHVTIHH